MKPVHTQLTKKCNQSVSRYFRFSEIGEAPYLKKRLLIGYQSDITWMTKSSKNLFEKLSETAYALCHLAKPQEISIESQMEHTLSFEENSFGNCSQVCLPPERYSSFFHSERQDVGSPSLINGEQERVIKF